jgi:hypothetical protein
MKKWWVSSAGSCSLRINKSAILSPSFVFVVENYHLVDGSSDDFLPKLVLACSF